ncbi:MAG TPA: PilZ domain-containing protein [Burkholderiales bacterium]|jgi:type IV pilus assembly protein PilZ|nr:PilZ domain-containing protein [Burkholderiales bacterium]
MSENDRLASVPARPGALALNIREQAILYAAYMPFVKGGGIFIPTTKPYRLGVEIFMLIGLLGDPNKIPVAGKVVWITPAGSQGGRAQGVGVQFQADESGSAARARIEGLLAGQLALNRPTHTM